MICNVLNIYGTTLHKPHISQFPNKQDVQSYEVDAALEGKMQQAHHNLILTLDISLLCWRRIGCQGLEQHLDNGAIEPWNPGIWSHRAMESWSMEP